MGERPQTVFKATAYGDDVDRALHTSDGSRTYNAGDGAYHYDKLCRYFGLIINAFGADHTGYIKRNPAATKKALSAGKKTLDINFSQMEHFLENGQPVRMSKRAGTLITLKEMVGELCKDAIRDKMVSNSPDMPIEFDVANVSERRAEKQFLYNMSMLE